MQKLQREEKQNQDARAQITNFSNHIASQFTMLNKRLNGMDGKLSQLELLRQKLPHFTQSNNPQLPVVVLPIKSEEQLTLTGLERKHLASVSGNEVLSAELLQSKIASEALNRSVTGEIAESFSELPLTPSSSPELPVQITDPNETPEIMKHIQVDPGADEELFRKGLLYLEALNNNNFNALPVNNQDDYLDAIRAIHTVKYYCAAAQKKGFLQGTIVMPELKIYNFYLNFVKLVNPELKCDGTDPLLHISYNRWGSSRDSSHYVASKKKYSPYGIDMYYRDGRRAYVPGNFGTILFGKINEKSFYARPEDRGIHISDVLGHAMDFAVAQARKRNKVADALRWALSFVNVEILADDNPLYKKERIPAEFKKAFAAKVKTLEISEEEKQQLLKRSQNGIQALSDPSVINAPEFQEMIADYRNRYGQIENQIGNELHMNINQLLELKSK